MEEYIVTLRRASRDNEGNLVAHQAGADLLLETNKDGYLLFPRDLFIEARDLLLKAEQE